MKLKLRYPAAMLCVISFVSFLGWLWSNWMLTNIGIDLKYMESETAIHLARQAEWTMIKSRMGWGLVFAMCLLLPLLVFRWFIKPSKAI